MGDGFVWSGNEAQAQLATVFDWKDAKTGDRSRDRSNQGPLLDSEPSIGWSLSEKMRT